MGPTKDRASGANQLNLNIGREKVWKACTLTKSLIDYLQLFAAVMGPDYMSHIKRKCVFGDFRPGNIQTSLLNYWS